eukprot:CAMPEP_0172817038 /NCGR_PEP_ID=MMETSP1075-20121228/12905_1 /TAXON_ID=2916 /ORGANISM="Ceratium fusus, Strain PA161109" /LENGTH=65 /DNA_ID=CAMNT_0013657153 /DNA_START=85 /DNA_END=278 /DNA_ORIENTATION=+
MRPDLHRATQPLPIPLGLSRCSMVMVSAAAHVAAFPHMTAHGGLAHEAAMRSYRQRAGRIRQHAA